MTTTTPRARFSSTGPFQTDLKKRVDAYFQRTGKARHGGWAMPLKTATLFAWLFGSYAVAMFAPVTWWQAALLVVSMGLALAGIGFSVMHDANHGSYARSARANKWLGLTSDLIGGSSYIWRQKHNILHHTYTNIAGLDDDLETGGLLRLAPWQPRRAVHRFQHLYVWVLYAVFPLRWWLIDDFRDVATARVGTHPIPRPKGWDLATLLLGKAIFISWVFVLPAILHPTWALIPLTLLGVAATGVVLATVFQLAHCLGEVEFHPNAEAIDGADFAAHQIQTTANFARGNRLLSWYVGGLNFQVEHHLFPRVSHVHYPELAKIVEQACRDHGIAYRAEPSLWSALSANVRWLRQLGRPDAGAQRSARERPRLRGPLLAPGGVAPGFRPRGLRSCSRPSLSDERTREWVSRPVRPWPAGLPVLREGRRGEYRSEEISNPGDDLSELLRHVPEP